MFSFREVILLTVGCCLFKALNNANREVSFSEDLHASMFRAQSPPASPRSLRNRPKLGVPFPEPPMRMRSSSSDYGSSIPIEVA